MHQFPQLILENYLHGQKQNFPSVATIKSLQKMHLNEQVKNNYKLSGTWW